MDGKAVEIVICKLIFYKLITIMTNYIECFMNFINQCVPSANDIMDIIEELDCELQNSGWQPDKFVGNDASIVFIYLFFRELTEKDLGEIDGYISSSLFLAYGYAGPEIEYESADFKYEDDDRFATRCLELVNRYSHIMFQFHHDPQFYQMIVDELTGFKVEGFKVEE